VRAGHRNRLEFWSIGRSGLDAASCPARSAAAAVRVLGWLTRERARGPLLVCHTRRQTGRQTDTDRQEGSDEQSYIATEQSNGMRYRHVRYGETSIKRKTDKTECERPIESD